MTRPYLPASNPVAAWQLVVLLVISGALWWHPLARTLRLAVSDGGYTHILLVVPLSCGLIYLERKWFRAAAPARVAGGACLVFALAIVAFARWGGVAIPEDFELALSMVALVVWWIGSVIFCFGTQTFQAFLFPTCFLFWIVPLPTLVLEEIIYFLQRESAFAAQIMFKAVGVPTTQDGVMLSLPDIDIEVARECSSIRSSMLLLITTMILAHLFLKSWWRKALLIAAVIPLAAIKNGFRIFTITELATRVDPSYFDGNLHHRGGILFLGIAFVAMCALLWGLRRTETSGLHSN